MSWMRSVSASIAFFFFFGGLVCSEAVGPERPKSTITVFVYYEDQSIAGKKVELMGTGESKVTDVNGLATFKVPPGTYTVRVYGINRGGPALQSVDVVIDVKETETQTVKVFDCLPCV